MKHCPACNFSFSDFHQLCDFDGTELVPDPKPPSLLNAPPRQSRLRRIVKSPTLLTSLAIVALFFSAVIIGYFDSDSDFPPVVKNPPSAPSLSAAQTAERVPAQIKTPIPSKRKNNTSINSSTEGGARRVTAHRSAARLQQRASAGKRTPKSETDLQKEPQPVSNEKGPKVIAILKSTWNVMKKPFKF
jgi:hypothetical protein